jgi:GH15 family glucan-1,4-alpha-glucosidase
LKIEDYALIGDCQSAALVSREGSIDWLCWPRFDAPACFASILGTPKNGRWCITPEGEFKVRRRYRPGTMILETEYETADGVATLIDFMPIRTQNPDLIRVVVGGRGRVRMRMEYIVRFDYGSAVPWVTRLHDNRGIRAIAGPDKILLCSAVPMHGEDFAHHASFEVAQGDRLTFIATYCPSHFKDPQPVDAERALAQTEAYWKQWCARCTATGEWSELVLRSLMTLKALTYAPTGGMVAAPTTSLPERIGGVRNWDYRYCWLRDATLTLLALMNGGYVEEAAAWREWLARAVAGSPRQMQIMYGIAGERRLDEWTLEWLPGYEDSAPVRVGNAASGQLQLDVYGEVMDVLHVARKAGLETHEPVWEVQRALLDHVEKVWTQPDSGLWEVRGPPRHFTYSKVMCWVAFDRAVKAVEQFGRDGPVERWREMRQKIHDDVCRNGWNEKRSTFVQFYGCDELDASLLLLPITGFLPCTDPRVRSTIDAIQRDLTHDGLVLRYRTNEAIDGLPPGEGVFLACTFWLADCLILLGRRDEARALFERLCRLANDVGLLAEEYDPRTGRQLGNFPQAFTHVALVNTAMNLSRESKPVEQRAEKKAA